MIITYIPNFEFRVFNGLDDTSKSIIGIKEEEYVNLGQVLGQSRKELVNDLSRCFRVADKGWRFAKYTTVNAVIYKHNVNASVVCQEKQPPFVDLNCVLERL